MSRLLTSEFSRLFKNKVFYIALSLCMVIPLLSVVSLYHEQLKYGGFGLTMDGFQNLFLKYTGILSSVVISLFVSKEFGNGTIRNKLIVGCTRPVIYISELIVCIVSGLIMQVAFIVAPTVPSFLLLGAFDSPTQYIIKMQLVGIFVVAAYSSIFVMISMLMDSRARASAVSLIVAVAMFIFGSAVYVNIFSPDFIFDSIVDDVYDRSIYNDSGVTISATNEDKAISTADYLIPDPLTAEAAYEHYRERVTEERGKYLSGAKRTFYLFFDDLLPSCQAKHLNIFGCYVSEEMYTVEDGIQINLYKYVPIVPPRSRIYVLYDCGIITVTTALGIFLFGRKDLK